MKEVNYSERTNVTSPRSSLAVTSNKSTNSPRVVHVAPLEKGNFFLSFDVDLVNGILVTGDATGAVDCWRLTDTLFEKNVDEKVADDLVFVATRLSSAADHSARYIYVKEDPDDPNNVVVWALYGHDILKTWTGYKKTTCRTLRTNNLFKNKNPLHVFTVPYGPRLHIYAMRSKDAIYWNLDYRMKREVEVPVLSRPTKVVACDGEHIVLLNIDAKTNEKRLTVYNIKHWGDHVQEFHFDRTSKHYWGFQLDGNLLAYISNHNVIKVKSLTTGSLVQRYASHGGYIVAMSFRNGSIISIATDHKLKIFNIPKWCYDVKVDVDYREIHGTLVGRSVFTSYNLPGIHVSSYPYYVIKRGNFIFYSANDGVYCVCLLHTSFATKA